MSLRGPAVCPHGEAERENLAAVARGPPPLLRPWGGPGLRLGHTALCPFIPQLLLKPKFSSVEKIKTIGSTYMAAVGLSVPSGSENQVPS